MHVHMGHVFTCGAPLVLRHLHGSAFEQSIWQLARFNQYHELHQYRDLFVPPNPQRLVHGSPAHQSVDGLAPTLSAKDRNAISLEPAEEPHRSSGDDSAAGALVGPQRESNDGLVVAEPKRGVPDVAAAPLPPTAPRGAFVTLYG